MWWVSLALVHAVGFFRFLCEGRGEESKAQQVMFVVLGKEVLHVLFGSSGTPFIMTNNDTKSNATMEFHLQNKSRYSRNK